MYYGNIILDLFKIQIASKYEKKQIGISPSRSERNLSLSQIIFRYYCYFKIGLAL